MNGIKSKAECAQLRRYPPRFAYLGRPGLAERKPWTLADLRMG